MKKVFFAMFAATLLFSLTTFAQVEEEQTQPEETVTAMAEEGMQIEFAQLPDAVQTAFESSDYAAWDVMDVRAINEEQTESIKYKIKVTDGTREESVLYNEEGEDVTEE